MSFWALSALPSPGPGQAPLFSALLPQATPALSASTSWETLPEDSPGSSGIDVGWYPPGRTAVNDLGRAVAEAGVYGFVFHSDEFGRDDERADTYSWCNMPRVRADTYVRPAEDEYELQYVEVIHRHHKRTPYGANGFPAESYPWNCDDIGLFYYGSPTNTDHDATSNAEKAARTYWKVYTSDINPFTVLGWTGSCQFPQITAGGLHDSRQHGHDLYSVYHDLLGFIPARSDPEWNARVSFRVTNNQITSQVAGMVVAGMSASDPTGGGEQQLWIQRQGVDGLEPSYRCPAGTDLFLQLQSSPDWLAHLEAAAPLFAELDSISGVSPSDHGFHMSLDHYYDNLSARQCHGKPLPCHLEDPSRCVTQAQADQVYRLGNWEYSYLYRDAPGSLEASAASYGVWIAELVQNIRTALVAARSADGASDSGSVRYRHNVAHDGSISRVLSILQIEEMVWPGMGSEVVFEIWRKKKLDPTETHDFDDQFRVRVLFSGRVLKSSSPTLGVMDMIPVKTLLGYLDALVGPRASKVYGMCDGSIPLV